MAVPNLQTSRAATPNEVTPQAALPQARLPDFSEVQVPSATEMSNLPREEYLQSLSSQYGQSNSLFSQTLRTGNALQFSDSLKHMNVGGMGALGKEQVRMAREMGLGMSAIEMDLYDMHQSQSSKKQQSNKPTQKKPSLLQKSEKTSRSGLPPRPRISFL